MNSVYVKDALYFLANSLKAISVTPDIGAKIALFFSFGNFILNFNLKDFINFGLLCLLWQKM